MAESIAGESEYFDLLLRVPFDKINPSEEIVLILRKNKKTFYEFLKYESHVMTYETPEYRKYRLFGKLISGESVICDFLYDDPNLSQTVRITPANPSTE